MSNPPSQYGSPFDLRVLGLHLPAAQIVEDRIQVAEKIMHLTFLPDANQKIFAQDRQNPDAFTCFPNLEPELRQIIWRCALPGPRIFDISNILSPRKLRHHYGTYVTVRSLFFVSRESRKVVQDVFLNLPYRRHQDRRVTNMQLLKLNTDEDTHYMRYLTIDIQPNLPRLSAQLNKGRWRQRIQILEIYDVFLDEDFPSTAEGVLRLLPNLKELHLVAEKSEDPEVWCAPSCTDMWKFCDSAGRLLAERKLRLGDGIEGPVIYLHEWRRIQRRTISERRDGAVYDYQIEPEVEAEDEENGEDSGEDDN